MKKGFIFFEIIIAVFLIGLISLSIVPIFINNQKNIMLSEEKVEMIYLGEHIFERLYSMDKYTKELMSNMINEVEFIDLDEKYLKKYNCTIKNEQFDKYLWNLKVVIEFKESRGHIPNVEFIGTIPKR